LPLTEPGIVTTELPRTVPPSQGPPDWERGREREWERPPPPQYQVHTPTQQPQAPARPSDMVRVTPLEKKDAEARGMRPAGIKVDFSFFLDRSWSRNCLSRFQASSSSSSGGQQSGICLAGGRAAISGKPKSLRPAAVSASRAHTGRSPLGCNVRIKYFIKSGKVPPRIASRILCMCLI